jgi:hypothetical protein
MARISFHTEETAEAISIQIHVAEGVQLEHPIHSCIGVMTPHSSQHIRLLEEDLGSGYGTAITREVMGDEGLVVAMDIDPLT